jgi:hypothetical protein
MPRAIAPDNDIDGCGLTYDELQELWLGPSHNGSLFNNEEELRDAWVRGRAVVMKLWATNGRRPMAWWHLGDAEALGLRWPGHSNEQSYLYEHGVLGEAECVELERSWRRAFDRNQGSDIPHSLRRQWQAERPRRGRKRAEPALPGSEAPLKSEAR